jgi:hypothetical protein
MAYLVKKVDVWSGTMPDEAGALDHILGALAEAGADLECVIARRQPDHPGTGVVYLTPVKGKKVVAAAQAVGLSPAANIATLRVEAPNKPGVGHKVFEAIASTGLNVRGISALAMGGKSIVYIGFDSAEEAARAAKAIAAAGKR